METCNFDNFHEVFESFLLKTPILIKLKAMKIDYLQSLIILKEIKKASYKFLRFWEKTQLTIEISYKIFNVHTKISIEY